MSREAAVVPVLGTQSLTDEAVYYRRLSSGGGLGYVCSSLPRLALSYSGDIYMLALGQTLVTYIVAYLSRHK